MSEPRKDDDVVMIRKPEVIAEVGGLIDETRVTLGVHGDDLDPDEVTRLLGCAPSCSHRRGDPRPRNIPPWPRGAWVLSVEGKAPVEPDHLISAVLDRLPVDPAVWESLRSRFDVRLGFGLFQDAWNRGFGLSSQVLRRVAEMGLGLDFDIYADGEEDGG
jgi:hypothetical protein